MYTDCLILGGGAAGLAACARLAQTGRVRQADPQPVDHDGFRQRVARRAGDVGDDGALTAQQRVEQAALSGVRPAAEHHAQALVLDASRARIAGGEQPVANRPAARVHLLRRLTLLHLVREVDCRGDLRQQRHDLLPRRAHKGGYAALHLPDGRGHRPVAARADHAHDGFRLRQIDAPVQKGAAGELAGPGHARAVIKQQQQNPAHQRVGAVAMDFGDVLARVAVRRGKEHGHCLVHHGLTVHHMAEGQHPGRQRLSVFGTEDTQKNLLAARARQAHDGDAALAAGGRLRGNGVV